MTFLYLHVNDLKATHHFYVDLIGLEPAVYEPKWGYLAFNQKPLQIQFWESEDKIKVQSDWAVQPGYQGGKGTTASWSIVISAEEFPKVVSRLQKAGVATFTKAPTYTPNKYWSFPVKDPMGNTVEIYYVPDEEPADKAWPH